MVVVAVAAAAVEAKGGAAHLRAVTRLFQAVSERYISHLVRWKPPPRSAELVGPARSDASRRRRRLAPASQLSQ